MKKNIKVSIIVPVFNAEKTLSRCVDSILNQTYNNIEIILVNDGSNDSSNKIIKSYSELYDNIISFEQKNSGAGIARNKGIELSTGDYLTFVDSDDKLKYNAIENMINCLKKDTDVVIGGFVGYDENDNVLFKMIPSDNYWTQFKFTSTVFKLYRRKFLFLNNIKYTKFHVFEDLCFCLNVYSKTKNIELNYNQDYIVYKNSESVTANFSSRPVNGCKNVLSYINENINLEKYSNKTIEFFYLKTLILNIFVQLDGHELKDLINIYNVDYNYVNSLNICGSKIKYHFQKYESLKIIFVVNLFVLFTKLHFTKFLICLLKKVKFIRV